MRKVLVVIGYILLLVACFAGAYHTEHWFVILGTCLGLVLLIALGTVIDEFSSDGLNPHVGYWIFATPVVLTTFLFLGWPGGVHVINDRLVREGSWSFGIPFVDRIAWVQTEQTLDYRKVTSDGERGRKAMFTVQAEMTDNTVLYLAGNKDVGKATEDFIRRAQERLFSCFTVVQVTPKCKSTMPSCIQVDFDSSEVDAQLAQLGLKRQGEIRYTVY